MSIYWLLHFRQFLRYRAVFHALEEIGRTNNRAELEAAHEKWERLFDDLVKHTPTYKKRGSSHGKS